MKKPVIATVTGIRPDFIRMSEVFKRLDKSECLEHILIHTGQHYDKMLSEVFFNELQIRKPDYNLECGGGDQAEQIEKLLPKLLETLKKVKADIVVYLGDSNSVITAPFVKKAGYKIAHIEAGMRSGDMRMFEEINRKICDMVTDYHFVYHNDYARNLMREGHNPKNIYVVGNTIVEPARKFKIYGKKEDYIVVDIHRPENFLDITRLRMVCEFLVYYQQIHKRSKVYFLSFPRTMQAFKDFDIPLPPDVEFIPLQSYKDYMTLMQNASFIISDSGTAQEEPTLFDVKVLVPRDYTERPQSYNHGCSKYLPLYPEQKGL